MQEIRRAAERAVDLTLPAERNAIAAYLNLAMVGSPKAVPSLYSDADERLTRVLRDAQPGREAGMPVDATSDHAHSADAGIAVSSTQAPRNAGPAADRDPCYHQLCDTLANVDRRVCCAWRGPKSRRYAK